jgi:hypothetical protein
MMMLGLCLLLTGAAVKPVGAASVSGSSDFSIYMNNEQLVIPRMISNRSSLMVVPMYR